MSPYKLVGRRIASVVLQPFVDVVLEGGDVAMRLKEVVVADGSRLAGKSVKDADVGHLTGAIVVGIHGKDGRPRVDPAEGVLSTVTLQQGDVLIATGNEAQLDRLKATASESWAVLPVRREAGVAPRDSAASTIMRNRSLTLANETRG